MFVPCIAALAEQPLRDGPRLGLRRLVDRPVDRDGSTDGFRTILGITRANLFRPLVAAQAGRSVPARRRAGKLTRSWFEASTSDLNPWSGWRELSVRRLGDGHLRPVGHADNVRPPSSGEQPDDSPRSTFSGGKGRAVRQCQADGHRRPKGIDKEKVTPPGPKLTGNPRNHTSQ
jgi:hypothetical protein